MTDLKKANKLIGKLQSLIEELETRPVIVLHRHINQFYYMQKSTELQLLHDQLKEIIEKEASARLRLSHHYSEVYDQWKKDARWFSSYLRSANKCDALHHNRSLSNHV